MSDSNALLDARYSFSFEYCGHPEPRHVARFCGSWIGSAESLEEAHALAWGFERNRTMPHQPIAPKHAAVFKADPFAPDYNVTNPIICEVTRPGRTDGIRAFRRYDGTHVIYDPKLVTTDQWERTTGYPLPLFTPSPKPPGWSEEAETVNPSGHEVHVKVDTVNEIYVVQYGTVPHPPERTPFHIVDHRVNILHRELRTNARPSWMNRLELWSLYQTLMSEASRLHALNGWQSHCDLTPCLIPFEGRTVQCIVPAPVASSGPSPGPRRFRVARSEGALPMHLEEYDNGRQSVPALRDYTNITCLD